MLLVFFMLLFFASVVTTVIGDIGKALVWIINFLTHILNAVIGFVGGDGWPILLVLALVLCFFPARQLWRWNSFEQQRAQRVVRARLLHEANVRDYLQTRAAMAVEAQRWRRGGPTNRWPFGPYNV